MKFRFLMAAVGLLVCGPLAAGQAPSGPLPAPLRGSLQNARFAVVTSIRGLPLGVRDQMQKMFGGTLDIAEPGERFQATDAIATPRLPIRRMTAAGCTNDVYCLVYYETGGIATRWRVMLFRWSPDATRFEWGGTAPGGLKTIEEVQKAVLSGSVTGQAGPW